MSRSFLTEAERHRLSEYPTDISAEDVSRFFTLTAADLEIIQNLRGDHNRLGFALQLCTLRYLGFIPTNLLDPPAVINRLLVYQLGGAIDSIKSYGTRDQTRSAHLSQIMSYLGYRRLSADDSSELEDWLVERALEHDKPTFLTRTLAERLRWERILRPGLTTLEKLVSKARERAVQTTYEFISHLINSSSMQLFNQLLEDKQEKKNQTLLKWLQQLPNDHTASQINTTLDKIQFLVDAGVSDWEFKGLNPNRVKMLAGIGSKATNQQLKRTSEKKRYPILIAFLKQSLHNFIDIAIDLFDACIWHKHTEAKGELDRMRLKAARSTNEKLTTFNQIAKIVIDENVPDSDVRAMIFRQYEASRLETVIKETENLIRPQNDEAIDLFATRYGYFRQFTPKLLTTLGFAAYNPNDPLLQAIDLIKSLNIEGKRAISHDAPTSFIDDEWWEYVNADTSRLNRRYYELAVLWELRLALRSGDIFVEHGRRYADTNTYLIPSDSWPEQRNEVLRLTSTSLDAEAMLSDREAKIGILAERVEQLFHDDQSSLREEDGQWILTPFEGEGRPESAVRLEKAIAERLPQIDITDLIIEVDQWTKLSNCFPHASSGIFPRQTNDAKYLFASILSQACNYNLMQMSRSSGLAYHQLVYASTWFLREETLKPGSNLLVNYHHGLDVSRLWGTGVLSSSDGQRFPVKGKNRKAKSILRYFGYGRGVTFYTWTSDQFSLYGSKAIASTIRDSTYVLDEILANETELPILEHTTDTNGYTEIVFALFDLLGLTFTPRIKDLADQQLYRTDLIDLSSFPLVRARLSKRINTQLIIEMWDEILRFTGSLKLGWVTASLAIQRLLASPRKSKLARALQEYGRLIKTLHVLGWYESEEKRRWANRQLNKGEAIHSLKAHLIVGNRGVLRRKTDEDLQHQVGCLNLLTNAIVLWNSVYMGQVLNTLKLEGYDVNPEDLKHIWPTRYEHINVYGKYDFDLDGIQNLGGLRELRDAKFTGLMGAN